MRNFFRKKEPYFSETIVINICLREIAQWMINNVFKKALIISTLILILSTFISSPVPAHSGQQEREPSESEIYVDELRTKMKGELIKEVHNLIKDVAPKSELTSDYLVEKCLEYDTDIIFVLSQALLESHFGTRGKAAKTKSVWNVGTYDDGQILYRYKTADESLEPYLKLVNEKYLIEVAPNGDTIYKDLHHLVEDRGYTNYQGARFASARGYENGMRKFMIKIAMETNISFYQDILRMNDYQILAFFRPETDINEIYFALN